MSENVMPKAKIGMYSSDILFQKLFYESKDMLLIFDFIEDKMIDVNESALKYSGYTRSEMMRKKRHQLTPQFSNLRPNIDLHATYLDEHARKVINGEVINELGIFLKKDNSELIAELDIIPTERKTGEAFIIIKDVTKKIKNKSKYKATERDYKSIVESTAAGITIVDLKGKHIYVSPQVQNMTGYTSEEMLGRYSYEFFKEGEVEKMKQYSLNLLKGINTTKSTIHEGIHKDGHSVWLQGRGKLVKDESNNVVGIQNVFIDISDKVLLEREIERTKDKFQNIIENLDGIFTLVDLNGVVEYVSPNYTSVFGYDISDVIGKKGLAIFNDDDANQIKRHSRNMLEGIDVPNKSIYKVKHKDGSDIWLSGTYSLIKDKNGNPQNFVSVYFDETTKIITQKELEKTKYKYQQIIENLNGVVSITELNGKTSFISPQIKNILGYHPEELIGKYGTDLFFESEIEKLRGHAENLILNKFQKVQNIYSGKHKDGTIRYLNATASLIKNKDNEPSGFVSVFFDITHEIETQQKLVTTEDRYSSLFNNAIDPIIVRDLETLKIIDCNRAAMKFFGLQDKGKIAELDEFSKRVTDKNGASFKEIVKAQLAIVDKETVSRFEVLYTNQEGEKFCFEINLVKETSDKESPKAIFFLKDITEQVLAFEKIKEERELLNAVIEGISDQIIVQDKDRKIIAVNSNFKKTFKKNYNLDLDVGMDMKKVNLNDAIMAFGDQTIWNKKINSVLDGQFIEHVYTAEVQEKRQHYSLNASPLRDTMNEIIGIIGASRNITELVEKNEEIAEKNIELQKYLDSNIQLENFAYIASHDLKQPLRTITSFSELLKLKKADLLDDDGNTYLDFILESTERLNALVSDMLAYSIIGTSGKKEVHDPNMLIRQVLHDLGSQIDQKNATIELAFIPTSISLYKSEFTSLIQNLISNSIKYSRDEVKPIISIGAEEDGDYWLFKVQDNGIGIEDKYLSKIFGMFQRLSSDRSTEGTGIGLAHCKKICELHGGKIWAESKLGKGTTFKFTIRK